MENKYYSYSLSTNGDYIIHVIDKLTKCNNDNVIVDDYKIYFTKRGGKKISKIEAQQELHLKCNDIYDSLEKMLQKIESEHANKLKSIREELL